MIRWPNWNSNCHYSIVFMFTWFHCDTIFQKSKYIFISFFFFFFFMKLNLSSTFGVFLFFFLMSYDVAGI